LGHEARRLLLSTPDRIALERGFLPEIPAGDLVRSQPQRGVMAGVIHQIGAAVLARIKPLGLCQPGIGYPWPRYLADDLGRAAQLSAAQVAVRVAAVDENRW
jgi:hypothetical protein